MKRDLVTTFIVEFLTLASSLFVFRLVSMFFGEDGFSEFALSKRTISLVYPILLLGMTVSIPRYIAFTQASADKEKKRPESYLVGGLLIITPIIILFTILFLLFKDSFASILFGSTEYAYLVLPIYLVIVGTILHNICYGYLRGKLIIIGANILSFINLGVVPIVAVLVSDNVSKAILMTGIGYIVVSSITLMMILRYVEWERGYFKYIYELMVYGIPRIPESFAIPAIFGLPAIFTAHMVGVIEAGYVAFGISILSATSAPLGPIAVILLPKASQLIARDNLDRLRYYTLRLLKITMLLCIAATVVFEIFAPQILNIYLGEASDDLVMIARIIMIGIPGYAVFSLLRSVLNAFYIKPVNTVNTFIAICFFLILSGMAVLLSWSYVFILFAFISSMFLLGILSSVTTVKIFIKEKT